MTLHVVGAGLAGLAAALHGIAHGERVVLHEAAPIAGGRCRSWHDATLDATIDNGAHVVVGANAHVDRHLAAIGSTDSIAWQTQGIEIVDLAQEGRWRFGGPVDIARHLLREPSLCLRGLHQAVRLLRGRDDETIGSLLDATAPLTRELWVPLATAVMNLAPQAAAAGPFARTLRRTLLRGASAMRVGIARDSLAASFIDPTLVRLRAGGATIRMRARLQAIDGPAGRGPALIFDDQRLALDARDRVILALPPWEVARLLPAAAPPHETAAIVNLHARLPDHRACPTPRLLGVLGSDVEWITRRGAMLCATVSAADRLIGEDPADLATRLWGDVARALALPGGAPPPMLIVKERRASPAQTPGFEARRPGVTTTFPQVLLAGDWVERGLPCTIDAALASGIAAARRALDR